MRLARLAVLGLAVGVIAGFAIALLRARPLIPAEVSPPLTSPDPRPAEATDGRTDGARAGSGKSSSGETTAEQDDATVLDVRTHRRVTG
jgi:hypothetical protein